MSTRTAIDSVSANLEESIGVRTSDSQLNLSPNPMAKDAGRRPLRNFGTVSLEQVIADPDQPRKTFDSDSIKELAASIQLKGLLQPIRVRWSEQKKKWVIIAGERRWRATQLAGLSSITCYFHEGRLSETEILEEQIVENIHRRSLQPMEEARSYHTLMSINGWNRKETAESLGVHPSKVSRAMALLKLPSDVQHLVESGKISARTAYEVSKKSTDEGQRQLAKEAAERGLTHDQTAKIVRQRRGGKKRKSNAAQGVHLTFQTEKEWQVTVARSKSGTYHDIEEAIEEALEEVRLRINNNVRIF